MKQVKTLPTLPKRKRNSHKGDYGRILIVGGSCGMIGAPALAAKSALRAGAGLVTIATPETVQLTIAQLAPCATSIPIDQTNGTINSSGVNKLIRITIQEKKFDVVAIGPGLGNAKGIPEFIFTLIEEGIPTVIDADGINLLAKTNWTEKLHTNCIITPHPGELARLLKTTTNEIQNHRLQSAQKAANLMKKGKNDTPICVLKGHKTIVTDGIKYYINTTGNPGLATGGSGDVLTGIIAGLLGQGLTPFQSACLGVYIHGLAGDLAAKTLTETSLIASDLIDYLPLAFKKFSQKSRR